MHSLMKTELVALSGAFSAVRFPHPFPVPSLALVGNALVPSFHVFPLTSLQVVGEASDFSQAARLPGTQRPWMQSRRIKPSQSVDSFPSLGQSSASLLGLTAALGV